MHCVGVIAKLTEGYVAGVADVASESVSFVIVVKNPVSSMPTACWAVAWDRYRMLPSQSTSDRCVVVGAMFASILATCSLSAK